MKEVESDEKGDEEEDDETTKPEAPTPPAGDTPPAGADNQPSDEQKKEDALVERVADKILPELKQTISDVVKEAVKPNEDKGGSDSEPKTPQLGGGHMARVMREATKMLQEGLAEYNRTLRK